METWPKNFKLIQYNELDSTNSEAKRLAFKDEINTCVFSRIQTNGKIKNAKLKNGEWGKGKCTYGIME